jgi:hypothetical protein
MPRVLGIWLLSRLVHFYVGIISFFPLPLPLLGGKSNRICMVHGLKSRGSNAPTPPIRESISSTAAKSTHPTSS